MNGYLYMRIMYYIFNLNFVFQIIAICDFLNYLRYIKLGLVKSSGEYCNQGDGGITNNLSNSFDKLFLEIFLFRAGL